MAGLAYLKFGFSEQICRYVTYADGADTSAPHEYNTVLLRYWLTLTHYLTPKWIRIVLKCLSFLIIK